MAGGNPVFDRLNKQIEQERYAGFGSPQGSQSGPVQGTQAASAGYAAQDAMSTQQLNDLYAQQAAGPVDTGRVTLDDIIVKSLVLFGITLAVAAVSWFWTAANTDLTLPFWLGGMFGTLILGFVIAFSKKVSVPLLLVYAALQGAFLGAFSQYINAIPKYEGVVVTAVLATLCTFAAMYVGYATGFVKVNDRTRRMFFFALVGYGIFSLLQVVLLMTGVLDGWGFGGSGSFGILISLFGVGLAAYSLAVDFDSIDNAVRVGAPAKYSWLLAHGLVVTLVWLYVEFVRLFARLRD
ncbi:membrane protein [Intrasporangium oryzae NRRL B-24470]|uniref:Membrane protein n=1 Tax=Intrasporangium oryzae NRRL B-24470 TaxID=1386089 RepID=W9G4K6_9MICO|nr:Bax inhibitor-1/YccA family protein [Intrasporangium oryzae]EWS99732.1 membrane protein [Intrasporangium oryzae NRRL B-24470]